MSLPKFIKNLRNKVSKDNPGHEFMEGSLHFNNGLFYHHSYEHEGATYAEISANKVNSGKRSVLQINSSPDENENEALRLLFTEENGNVKEVSNIYGEHFKPTPEEISADKTYNYITNVDILQWASSQTSGGTFATNPTVSNTPIAGYWRGLLVCSSGDRGLLLLGPNHAYWRGTNGGSWEGTKWDPIGGNDLFLPRTGGNMYGEIVSETPNNYRIIGKNPVNGEQIGSFFRNDGQSTYLLLTNPNDPSGSWNDLRPIVINNTTGRVNMGNGLNVNNGYIYGTLAGNVQGGLGIVGYGNQNATYYQSDGEFNGNTGWSHYLIFNHHDGASYYNVMMAFPFWSVPMYRRQEGNNTTNLRDWQTFYTTENVTCGTGSASIDKEKGIYIRY